MLQTLHSLDRLERGMVNLSIEVNLAYSRLGSGYQSHFEVSTSIWINDTTLLLINQHWRRFSMNAKTSHPRTEQALFLDYLYREPMLSDWLATSLGRTAFKKRLQRARKFELLKRIFGLKILYAAPDVSVSRVDAVKLHDLEKLASGSVEGVRVKRIILRVGESG